PVWGERCGEMAGGGRAGETVVQEVLRMLLDYLFRFHASATPTLMLCARGCGRVHRLPTLLMAWRTRQVAQPRSAEDKEMPTCKAWSYCVMGRAFGTKQIVLRGGPMLA